MIQFFNTETRRKEPLEIPADNTIRIYTCGPTVYDYAHIGNFRTYVFEDLLRRSLQFFGLKINQVMNLTDVDDKTIRGALREGVDLNTYTQKFKDAFFEDLGTLGIKPVEHNPQATDYIEAMIKMIETLLEKGIAYRGADGSVYYAIEKFAGYGRLSGLKLDELEAGRSNRVENDEYDKESASDFVLWKAHDDERDGNIFWESPFGPGRPGWHLECSAMAMELLGDTIDIHCGGVDNIFPHHDNEIAQSEACSGKCFAKLWLHSEHLLVDNKKMSKSLGNFYTLRDLLAKGYTGQQVRYMLLQTHYKTQLNFTLQGLDAARHSLQRIHDFAYRMQNVSGKGTGTVQPHIDGAKELFRKALGDDLNISSALAALFDLVREINVLADQEQVSASEGQAVLACLEEMDRVLGVIESNEEEIPEELTDALQRREQARRDKNWSLADELRDLIHAGGYEIDDTPQGSRLKKR